MPSPPHRRCASHPLWFWCGRNIVRNQVGYEGVHGMANQALFGRRTALRSAALGAGGLAAAALLGCGSTPEKAAPAAANAPAVPAAVKLLNEAQQAANDPSLPFPLVVPEPDTKPKLGGTYREAWYNDFGTWDVTAASSLTTNRIPNDTGDTLLGFIGAGRANPVKIEIEPRLARSWETAPDGITITFKLTDKAKFHNKPPLNGRALTAEDVRLVYERDRSTGVTRGFFDNVASITAVNPTTLQIKLKAPNPDFLIYPATREMVIYAMELIDNGALAKNVDSIGSGAWILKSAVKSSHVSYVRNPDYWDGVPYIEAAEIKIMIDQAGRLAAMRAGQVDFTQQILRNKREADAFRASNPEFHIIGGASAAAVGSVLTYVNLKNPKWQDERVRQGISLLFDRERQLQVLFENIGFPQMRNFPWSTIFDKRPTAQAEIGQYLRYDPAEGKKLLQAATGQSTFRLDWINSPAFTTEAQVGYAIDSFQTNGVTITPKLVDASTLASQFSTNQFPDASSGTLIRYTTDNFYKDMTKTNGSLNPQRLSDPQLDEWANQQSVEVNPQKRRETLRKIWDYTGQKAYFPFEQASGFAPGGTWPKYLRNFYGGISLNSALSFSDVLKYMGKTWLDK